MILLLGNAIVSKCSEKGEKNLERKESLSTPSN